MPASCPTIPRATYRLQFHSGFTFADAMAIVPYLAELGISHIYASPYLKARPGSQHGYDIIDHNAINPEIGDSESFAALCGALSAHGMGQILDFVPNHVGIFGAENQRFLDVLTWGEDSQYAEYFDFDWRPAKPELHGKLLVPLLGDAYGAILSNGELKLKLDDGNDGFSIWYYENRLPLTPGTFGRILRPAIERLLHGENTDPARDGRLALLAAGFDELRRPTRTRPARLSRFALAERLRGDLAEALRNQPRLREHLDAVIAEINGIPGDPASFRRLHQLLEAQHFRLAYWRVAAEEINYRRFFQINDLAGIRVEMPEVFDAIHRLVFQWIDEGRVHGLRIDHIDGLFDPRQYLERLQQRFRQGRAETSAEGEPARLYVVVEKIIAQHESLPTDWPIAGTTGYDYLNAVNALFVNPEAEAQLSRCYEEFIGARQDFHEIAYSGRKLAMEQELASELRVLANEINHLTESDWFTRDFTLVGLRQALREIVACFPVYRTYVDWHGIRAEDRRDLDWAVAHGRRRSDRSDLTVFDFLLSLLTTDIGRGRAPALNRREVGRLAMKFQQYTGAVMAKGVEDTAFYRYNRLISLNEVGGEPTRFGTTTGAFHRSQQHAARHWPNAMLSTATHDTKRGEDVRARISGLSELVEDWAEGVQRWSTQNRRHRSDVNDVPAPSENDEYLFYQVLLGAWPTELMADHEADADAMSAFRDRMREFMLKAVREGKAHSSWINPDAAYEQALMHFVDRALDVSGRNLFVDAFSAFARRAARIGVVNSLAQTTLKLTSPGVPDVYQGCELWDLSLVDPDNRRPVDFGERRKKLRALRHDWRKGIDAAWLAELLADWPSGRVKLFVSWRLLDARRAAPALFEQGSYKPVATEGAHAENLGAFQRTHDHSALLVIVPRLVAAWNGSADGWPVGATPWQGTDVLVPEADATEGWHNAFTGAPLATGTGSDGTVRLPVADLLSTFPVGVWMRGIGDFAFGP
ncbi:Malto-oligosyltrehalose synthase [Candidatus Defluviicoccus seviourii]|uniref:Malto-oligosyltrehalose synthase n=1 Tax=Candidatus Defluviicoccus seviourii TaxID=2565273 RepID=A0A564WBW9_9PROT|nr:Malto-oligosyltrehalose synthase [Candidatus Defluviicoccus seviourii]